MAAWKPAGVGFRLLSGRTTVGLSELGPGRFVFVGRDRRSGQSPAFATAWNVPFDNNASEQAIRMAKIQLNVSGC
ncbi:MULTISPECIES: hypothetical protein [unclassified Streptomyces]|uniref:hypothetical protein n=1 Tax=unclassified Streptomyces TaxID=2593676 RepID=UPI00037EBCE5|nr:MULTISPECIES: hypothetical protein [unclassified Streptomyces]MYT30760.1 hypothetical protein [Streptomyces sp. SID8354]